MPSHGIRTVYQPFSLQERMAPLNMMKEEYDKINEGLVDLEMTAGQAAQYIDPESNAGKVLAAYNKSLEDAATTLSSEGLKGLSRTALYNLKRTYQREIAPINEGAKNYAALQAQIKQMQWKDPTIMVNDMPTLDEYIKNPNALPNVVSGAQLMQAGATAALTLPNVTYEQLSRYMNGDKTAIPDLDRAVQSIANNYGVTTDQALAYIQRGVESGLGERTTKWETTKQEYDYKHALDMEKERYEQQQQNARHYSSLAQNQQHLIAEMQKDGWGWDPSLNGGKGGWYQDDDTLSAARKAYLASQGYDSDSTRPWSTTRSRQDVEDTVKEDYNKDFMAIDKNGDTVDTDGNSVPAGANRIFPYTDEEKLKLIGLDNKVSLLRLAGIDISGARNASSRKEEYVESTIDELFRENIGRINRFEYFISRDGKTWYRRHKNETGTVDGSSVYQPPVQIDSARPSTTQEFGVTRRQ